MRNSYAAHTLEKDRDDVLVSAPSEKLALVDLDSYPAFIGRDADYFDMMAHLSGQMQALTVVAWKAPNHALSLDLRLAEDDRIFEETHSHRSMIASGNVRSHGRLCLTTHERLFDSARHRTRQLLGGGRMSKLSSSRVFHVPPGVYSIFIYYQGSFPREGGRSQEAGAAPKADYTVLLRHYPFPPPRAAPVRLSSGFPPATGEQPARLVEGAITSHWPWETQLPASPAPPRHLS